MTDWSPLRTALARHRDTGVNLPVWWRDDDATKPTPALDQLETLAAQLSFPVHLAVIPKTATEELAKWVAAHDLAFALGHGWTHQNHAPDGYKKSEFGQKKDGSKSQITKGYHILARLFEGSFLPFFVPPWNRLDTGLLPDIRSAGYLGLSTFTARSEPHPLPGLTQINCHVDPIDWRGTRGLKDPELIIGEAAARIDARIEGCEDASEPLGYLTHHLVHTPEIWEFSARFLGELLEGGATIQPLPLRRSL